LRAGRANRDCSAVDYSTRRWAAGDDRSRYSRPYTSSRRSVFAHCAACADGDANASRELDAGSW
jgi:hypothetical protein